MQFFCGSKVNCFRFPRASLAAATEAPAAEDAATSSPLQNHLSGVGGAPICGEPVGASSVQRPSSVRGAPPGETLGIFGGRVSPQLGKDGREVHNQKFLSSSHSSRQCEKVQNFSLNKKQVS